MRQNADTKKKNRGKTACKVFAVTLAVLLALAGITAAVNAAGIAANRRFISRIAPLSYETQLHPEKDAAGRWMFTADGDFKILQLSDIHIGGGFMSIRKDNLALNAVAAMITAEQPDLVVFTGDLTYPVPVQVGTFNNKENAKLLANLME